jgi:hypothetical protein
LYKPRRKQDGITTLLLILSLIISSTAFSEETATFELNITKGILSLDQQKYTEATQYLRAALKEKPDDPSANLYLGIALCNSGNEQEGEKLLKKALKLEPSSPRTNLELGILYYKRGIYSEAKDFFETVRNVAKGTDLSDIAEDYIRKIKERKIKVTVKDWSLTFTGGIQYDSNVVLDSGVGPLPEGITRKSDWRGIIFIEGKFTPRLTDKITLGPTYSFYQSLQTELDDFNVQQHLPGFLLNISLDKNVMLKTSYTYEYTTVGNDEYLSAHSISPTVTVAEGRGFFTALRYRYQNKDFRDSDLFPNNSERDGFNHLAGITQYIPLTRIGILGIGYTYDHDSTDKDYWSYNGHAGDINVRLDMGESWFLDLYGQYYQKDYKADYPGTFTTREDKMITFSTNLTKTFASKFDITVGWMYVNNDSNINIFEYDRNITTLTLRVSL